MARNVQTIEDLRPDPRNANQGTSRGHSIIEQSIRTHGAGRSGLAAKDGTMIAGSQTLEEMAALGIPIRPVHTTGDEWVVVVRDDVEPGSDQAALMALEDNRATEIGLSWSSDVLAGLSEELDLSGLFREDELAELLAGMAGGVEPGGGGDDFDPTPQDGPTRTQSDDLWVIGGVHRLVVGDCTDPAVVERLMGGERADCVFTSPPYAVGVDYGEEYEDTIENLREMLPKLSVLWLDVVTPGGFAVVNFGDIASGRNIAESDAPCEYPMAMEYWPVFRADGWLLWSRRIWCKPNPRVHSPWCIQSNRAATDWEHLWTWRKPGEPILRRVDGEMRSALGWIDTSLMHGVDVGKEIHGAGMALGIVEWMLNIHSRRGRVVFEPFGGTGTTTVGGHRLGRKVYSCEIVPRSADVILRRAEAEGLTVERAADA